MTQVRQNTVTRKTAQSSTQRQASVALARSYLHTHNSSVRIRIGQNLNYLQNVAKLIAQFCQFQKSWPRQAKRPNSLWAG